MGVGSVLDTHHEGEVKNPTEDKALGRLANWEPSTRKSPLAFFREIAARREAERAARMKSDEEGPINPEK